MVPVFVVESWKRALACIRTGSHACSSVHGRVSAQSCLVCDSCHSYSHMSMTVRTSTGVLDDLCSAVFAWTYAWRTVAWNVAFCSFLLERRHSVHVSVVVSNLQYLFYENQINNAWRTNPKLIPSRPSSVYLRHSTLQTIARYRESRCRECSACCDIRG